MQNKTKGAKTLRISGVATLVIAAAVVLSGCAWNTVRVTAGFDGQHTWRNFEATLTQGTTNDAIWNCTRFYGSNRSGVAGCVLDVVDGLCHSTESEFYGSLCTQATDRAEQTHKMLAAIYAPVGVLGNTECLAYRREQVFEDFGGPVIFENRYWTAENTGSPGCPNAQ
jgi:hypothetical protein